MPGLPISDHPIRWRVPVTPSDLSGPRLHLIAGAAIAAGAQTDAVVAVDETECARRASTGMDAVRSLTLLDVLLGLPLGCPISIEDLNEREARVLRQAPGGCVDIRADAVIRTLRVPTTVVATVIRATRWRAAIRRAAAFSAFTQRVVVLSRVPKAAEVFEAQLAGIGIWVEDTQGGLTEHLAPDVFTPIYFKAAGWRFAENAFAAALKVGLVQRPSAAAFTCC